MNLEWKMYGIKSDIRQACKKLFHKQMVSMNYAGKNILTEDEASNVLQNMVASKEPFMASRFGFVEIETMVAVFEYLKFGKNKKLADVINKGNIFNNAGFFPKDKGEVIKFGKMMFDYCKDIDMLGVWYVPYEDYIAKKLAPDAKLTLLHTYEPWNEKEPWTKSLKEKKVLVVHPFSESIQQQYERREQIFSNPDMLPEFELKTYKAIQTIGGNIDSRYTTWFDVLRIMHQDIMKIDFDIAIIGCGAYGFPLAAKLKQEGKQAVHIGGATQLLFGIKGGRWDNHPVVSKLYNDAWVRPMDSETPNNAQKVENKCYW